MFPGRARSWTAQGFEWSTELVRECECFPAALPAGGVSNAWMHTSDRERDSRQRSVDRGAGVTTFNFSMFKQIPLNERFNMEFRAEFFNILNHPTFNAPGFGGNGVTAVPNSANFTSSNFGEIGSTRFAPYDPRQIQFALKLYY